MMSLPASRYWWWILPIDVGPREHEQVVVALEIAWMVREALAAEVRFGRACGAGSSCPSRRRGRGCASPGHAASSDISLMEPCPCRVSVSYGSSRFRTLAAFRAGRNQHGERIAGLARADADPHVSQTRADQHPLQLVVGEPERRSPSLARTQSSWCVRRSSTSTRPPGAVIARRLGDGARRLLARDAAPATASPRRPAVVRSAASRARRASR